MTQINFELNIEQLELLMIKLKLDRMSSLSLALQIKNYLLQSNDNEPIDEKIKKQQYLKLCLQNWQSLKSSGHIMEEAKAIILGHQELTEPRLNQLFLVQDNYCNSCKHYHARTKPKVCKLLDCNCGIRG